MIKKCEVCTEVDHRYRCPQCRLLYCSVPCYKTHKETCRCIEEKVQESSGDCCAPTEETVPMASLEFELKEDEAEDRVLPEQLAKLEQSKVLKDMLGNPHLRTMMKSLVSSATPADQLATAMQEPIFAEFADRCLAVINDQEDDYISD